MEKFRSLFAAARLRPSGNDQQATAILCRRQAPAAVRMLVAGKE
jgi:hypothetical protein